MVDGAKRDRIFAMLERAKDGDVRRWRLLTAAIRRLEALWYKRRRQAGMVLAYGFRGEVQDRRGSITADVIIAYEAWSGAVRTDVQKVTDGSQGTVKFIAALFTAFPHEYRGFLKVVKLIPSGIELTFPSCTMPRRNDDDDESEDFEFQLSRAWQPRAAGTLTYNGARTLVQLRRELLEWERVHNCQTLSVPSQGLRGGDASNASAAAARSAAARIGVEDALRDPAQMLRLKSITESFTPARRIEIAVYKQLLVESGEVPITSSDVARLLTRSKKNTKSRLPWGQVSSDLANELIGRAIRLARQKNSLTQTEAARMLGIKRQQLSRLEANPSTVSKTLLSNVLSLYGEDVEDVLPIMSMTAEAAQATLRWLDETDD